MRRAIVGALLAASTVAPAGAGDGGACLVVRDAAGDVQARKVTGQSDDVVAVRLDGEDDDVLAVEIEVSALSARAGARAQRWAVTWINPWLDESRALQHAVASRDLDGVRFTAGSAGRLFAVAGALEGNVVRIEVPRAPMRLVEGALLEQVYARTWVVAGEAAYQRDTTGAGEWVVGPGCDTPVVQQCPVVVDEAGDAGIGRQRRTQVDPALDLRAVGVAPAGELLELSARVQSSTALVDADVRRWGYTVTWWYGGVRWFAQAERDASGTVFRYGRAAGPGPTLAGGARAAGRLDGRLLRIWVPRARVGMPADGDALLEVTAWSWLLAGPRGAAAYHTADETAARRAITGVACGA